VVALKRVCLLTGASGRLGTAFCRAYADRYDIVALYRTRPPAVVSQLQRMVDPLAPGGSQENGDPPENAHPVFAVQADLSRDADLARVVEVALARFDRIDVVIHAGVRYGFGSILGSDAVSDSAEEQLKLNVVVPLRLAALVAREFWQKDDMANRADNRSWINVSSTSATNVYAGRGQSVYAAAKAGMNALTRHMADEFAAIGVRVNAIAPNSFPQLVSTASVVAGLRELDESSVTGKILTIGRSGNSLT
jgi:NAD(P)-dependent dehydrogenase (short-subunit alcohol dehydrogenase family)